MDFLIGLACGTFLGTIITMFTIALVSANKEEKEK